MLCSVEYLSHSRRKQSAEKKCFYSLCRSQSNEILCEDIKEFEMKKSHSTPLQLYVSAGDADFCGVERSEEELSRSQKFVPFIGNA